MICREKSSKGEVDLYQETISRAMVKIWWSWGGGEEESALGKSPGQVRVLVLMITAKGKPEEGMI